MSGLQMKMSASVLPRLQELSQRTRIIAAAEVTGAEAIHPGYGFC